MLWDLVWAGRISNDTLAPLRALIRGGTHRPPHAPAAGPHPHDRVGPAPDARRRGGPPETAGRWAILPALDDDPTRRAHAVAERLLDRHGVVTRGAVASERVPGGFAAVYKVLAAFEETGRCRRGYFVGTPGRGPVRHRPARSTGCGPTPRCPTTPSRSAVALAATDPANPYGAALPWPERPERPEGEGTSGHRPGRKAGALVVLVDGALTLYVERGGKTLLTWPDDAGTQLLEPAAHALADAARRGALGRITVEKADGEQLLGSGATPAAGGPRRRRLRRHPARAEAASLGRLTCPRATPSGGPPGSSHQGLVGPDARPQRLPGPGASPPPTSRAARSSRRSPAASTCSPASTTTTRGPCTPT